MDSDPCLAILDPRLNVLHQHSTETSLEANCPSALLLCQQSGFGQSLAADLQSLGLTPSEVSQPLDAIWHLSEGNIDFVFVEYGFSGRRFLRWLRFLAEAFPYVKRIVFSQTPIPQGVARCFAAGNIDAVLVAPFEIEALEDLVQSSMTKHN